MLVAVVGNIGRAKSARLRESKKSGADARSLSFAMAEQLQRSHRVVVTAAVDVSALIRGEGVVVA